MIMNIAKLIPSLITLSSVAVDFFKSKKKEEELIKYINAYEDDVNSKFKNLYKEIDVLKNVVRLLFLAFGVITLLLIIAFVLIIFLIKSRG